MDYIATLDGAVSLLFVSWCSNGEDADLVADGQASKSEVGEGSVRKHSVLDLDVN